ncbi:MAG: peptidase S8, partial [Acidobacteria bacterium]|nr:peptidase S8 [Acidobacteriota bacterium]NIM61338.1 peptidase S8 [Acidobacteriota bacterium]NIO60492.1 peptidase S8 [Acidobacteriota bacterium]NIQ31611.1 peptidase S8 [Acidobacteriota bacterium]NIQ86862.1 peptidase S8 [Acidobacteriota bacterium]
MTTAKAFMINTADQYPFSGTADDLTRVHQGWGTPSVKNLYDLRDNISFIDESVVLANMETVQYVAIVDPGEPALRFTMTYADPAGNPAAAMHRINDISLKVTSPSSVEYHGNNG